ncbi:dihydroneopterin aldolase [Bosea sp. NBC_00550]|uniref:dihydroneopterin aldolase n=1 Tax=Bosea sp. NBC_00550 TaxID=2969621 RepID=UPI00222E9AB2|nr:dihydroneopterin aldolase [Bosea sp. NBC_00550]UZF95056.1 dihydroneopterin aldolase [Bosea sp. NBC_00550]
MSETGSILIEKLDIYAYHGFFSEEERLGQRFVLDILLAVDIRASAISDKLADTVDYGNVVAVAIEAFTARRYNLLEAAARAVAFAILERFPPVGRVEVTLRKPGPPIPATLGSVGIKLDFRRED